MNETTRTMSITDAAPRLSELVAGMSPNEESSLTVEGKTVAKIVRRHIGHRRLGGACKGMLTIIKEDDEHLADFKVYM